MNKIVRPSVFGLLVRAYLLGNGEIFHYLTCIANDFEQQLKCHVDNQNNHSGCFSVIRRDYEIMIAIARDHEINVTVPCSPAKLLSGSVLLNIGSAPHLMSSSQITNHHHSIISMNSELLTTSPAPYNYTI